MVQIKFVIRLGKLALRITETKDQRYFRRVGCLLIGNPNLRYWSTEKQSFSCHAPNYKLNNDRLARFKSQYVQLAISHPEMTAQQIAEYYPSLRKEAASKKPILFCDGDPTENVSSFLQVLIEREKQKTGCNFEVYEKHYRKCLAVIPDYERLCFSHLNYDKMIEIAQLFAKSVGYLHATKAFRAVLGHAHKDQKVNFDLKQIGAFSFADFNPERRKAKDERPTVLDRTALDTFFNMDAETFVSYRNKEQAKLFHDVCIFMFHTFLSPCDIIQAQHADITRRNTLLLKRKKTGTPIEVPITPVMQRIIEKYRGCNKQGYIFPIMDKDRDAKTRIRDCSIKHFNGKMNRWLGLVGDKLNCPFKLHAYVFRHTAISVAIDNNLPIAFVASAAGTSIEMIQKHYYNGFNQTNMARLQNAFMSAMG